MGAALFGVSLAAYLLSGVAFLAALVSGRKRLDAAGFALQGVGLAAGAVGFALAWRETGYPPMRNLFESLTLMAHLLVGWHLLQARIRRFEAFGPLSGFAGGLLLAWASTTGGPAEHTLPALQNSLWLTSHVFLSMLSYAVVLAACAAALMKLMGDGGAHRVCAAGVTVFLVCGGAAYLVLGALKKAGVAATGGPLETGGVVLAAAFVGGALALPLFWTAMTRWGGFARLEGSTKPERALQGTSLAALAFLSLAIMTGSVWGDVAWGRYWGWDPKEVWAFITWVSLLSYLHLRRSGGRAAALAPWAVVAGFLTVLFNYFGVNFLLVGLHSYAG